MHDAANEPSAHVKVIKHDIKNQLSNITLSLSQLRYELPEGNEDAALYLDIINNSCVSIDAILNNL